MIMILNSVGLYGDLAPIQTYLDTIQIYLSEQLLTSQTRQTIGNANENDYH